MTKKLFTAHCLFSIRIQADTQEQAFEIFQNIGIDVVHSKPRSPSGNWRGIDFCPPQNEAPGEWLVPVYIKVFVEGDDLHDACSAFDAFYPDVTDRWPDGKPKVETTSSVAFAWSYEILPSVGSDLEPQHRSTLSWPENKAWQMRAEIAAENRIEAGEPIEVAVLKIFRHYQRPLNPEEVTDFLKGYGVDLSGLPEGRLTYDDLDAMQGLEKFQPQEGAVNQYRLRQ